MEARANRRNSLRRSCRRLQSRCGGCGKKETEVWSAMRVKGESGQQRLSKRPSYAPTAHWLAQLNVDVITINMTVMAPISPVSRKCWARTRNSASVLSHRELQVELPDDIAALIRKALNHVEPGACTLSSDCGFGQQGMSRTHAIPTDCDGAVQTSSSASSACWWYRLEQANSLSGI